MAAATPKNADRMIGLLSRLNNPRRPDLVRRLAGFLHPELIHGGERLRMVLLEIVPGDEVRK